MAGETILIVDDSRDIIDFLRRQALEPAGYQVLVAYNGQSGLEMTLEHNPDLILLDMSMPLMDGMEMLRALRQTMWVAVPVIFMTMYGSENLVVEAFRLGVKNYLTKPVTVEDVLAAVEAALKEQRWLRERENLLRELISTETLRKTVARLTQTLKDDIRILESSLGLLSAIDSEKESAARRQRIAQDGLSSAQRVAAALRVMERLSEETEEHSQRSFDQAITEELQRKGDPL